MGEFEMGYQDGFEGGSESWLLIGWSNVTHRSDVILFPSEYFYDGFLL